MDWQIIRTALGKEAYVAAAIARKLACPAWVPIDIIAVSRNHRRHMRPHILMERPLLPKALLAAIPTHMYADLAAIRYFERIERDAALLPLSIPGPQVAEFRAAVEADNAAAREHHVMALAPRRDKARWVSATPQTLGALLAEMFGDPVLAAAA